MLTLQPPDSHHWMAAQGWLELEVPGEARLELEKIHPGFRNLPETLTLNWEIAAAEKNWNEAKELGIKLVRFHPDLAEGWIQRSYALHELGRTLEAFEALEPAWELFPDCDLAPYNLSCYCCCLGKIAEALKWIKRAISIAGADCIYERAEDDPDLQPLIQEIRRLAAGN